LKVDDISHADHWKHSLGWQIRPLFMSIFTFWTRGFRAAGDRGKKGVPEDRPFPVSVLGPSRALIFRTPSGK
jgi:hypothetical protein